MNAPLYPVLASFPGPAPKRGMFSAADFARRSIQPRPWLVPDMIPGRQVSTIDGDGGAGKSTLAQQLLVSAVTGRNWLGQRVAQGPVIYLSAEDDGDEIHRRLASICTDYRVGFEDLADLHVWPLADTDPALVTGGQGDALEPTERWRELLDAVARIKPVALVLDSRADVFGGNEISRAQARGFIALLRNLAVTNNLAVILLAHPSVAGMASGTGNSGSTHWRNAVRSALYLTRPNDQDTPDPDARVLSVMKSNYGPGGLSLKLRWSAGAFVVDGDEEAARPTDKATATARVDATFLRLLTTFTAQGRAVSHKTGHAYAPALFAKDEAAGGATKAGLAAAMNRLFNTAEIVVETYGPPSRGLSRIARQTVGAPS
ncbi:AAA family ATPase [Caulobacter sp. DWP3-1-3b2]|uniref:AAA family ATPase n=1 Tax=Caulobacter sp. DWP3-1-3b2 TaxID=2804643 RepID=UPI003CF4E9FA